MAKKLNKFRCINTCTYDNRLWTAFEKRLMFSKAESVPHFENISSLDKEDKMLLEEQDRLDKIKAVLIALDREDDELWTKDGLPQVKAVEESAELDTSRGEITKSFPGFTRESDIAPISGVKPDAFLQ